MCLRHQRHVLGLHVGRVAGVGCGAQIVGRQPGGRVDPHAVRLLGDLDARQPQLLDDRLQVVGTATDDLHRLAEQRPGDQVRPGLDAVRDDLVRRAVQRLAPLDRDLVGAGPGNRGPHGIQHGGQVDDLGLLGAVAEHGGPVGQRRGHHQVLGGADAADRTGVAHPVQPLGPGFDVTVLQRDLGPHLFQPLEVQVDRALADGAAARQ